MLPSYLFQPQISIVLLLNLTFNKHVAHKMKYVYVISTSCFIIQNIHTVTYFCRRI
jgi:hypothetical protein